MPEPKLFLEIMDFKGLEIKISNDESTLVKQLTLTQVCQMHHNLTHNLQYMGQVFDYMQYHHDFNLRIKERLDNDAKHFDDENQEYRCGGNFAFFINYGISTTDADTTVDNNTASTIIRMEYEEEYPNHTLIFDSESSYSYVYTTSREEAERFLNWLWLHYYKPWVDKHIDGYYEFITLIENATNEEKQQIQNFFTQH